MFTHIYRCVILLHDRILGFFYLTVRLQARDFYKVEDDNLTMQGLFTSAGYRGTKDPGYEVGKMILLKTVVESHG